MAMGLDKYVFSDDSVRANINMSLDFVGYFDDWSSTNLTACVTSSGWSECIVNAYHLCGHAVVAPKARAWSWWLYSSCLYANQYPGASSAPGPGLECAGPNPWANSTCTAEEFPAVVASVSDTCAEAASLPAADIKSCVAREGVELLKGSFKMTASFPRNPNNKTEPQWIQVDGPECAQVGWSKCEAAFDKTHCLDWDACDSDAWAQHIRSVVCAKAGLSCA